MEAVDLDAIERLVVECRSCAMGMARDLSRKGLSRRVKDDKTFVTEADLEIERALRRLIGQRFPEHRIFGEEEGGHLAKAKSEMATGHDVVWVIDPIDGTFSFMNGVPFYSSLLAVLVDGVPMVGSAALPELDWVLHGRKGQGARFNGEPVTRPHGSEGTCSDILAIADPYRFRTVGAAAVVDKLLAEPYRTRVYPDALGYMLLLKGAVCGFVDPRTEVWDVAPFHVILPEAGYEIAKWDGAVSLTPGAVYSYPSGRRDETLAALLLQESGSRD